MDLNLGIEFMCGQNPAWSSVISMGDNRPDQSIRTFGGYAVFVFIQSFLM